MVLAQRIFRASDTGSIADFPKELEGFLLSRLVEDCTPRTLQTYRQRIGAFFKFSPGRLPSDIERVDIEHFLLHLKEKGCAPAYIHTNYRSLHAFFEWCVDEEIIPRSPMRKMKPPKIPKIAKPFLSEEQFQKLLYLCPPGYFIGARERAKLWMFWSTGMRLKELANLQLSDIDWEKSKIRVLGKGRKERYVPFSKDSKKAVWRYLSYRKDDLPNLWVTEERQPMRVNGVVAATQRLINRAGLEVKDAHHIFRRTWAMRQLKAGVSVKFVQLIGGWEDVKTLDSYVRAMQSDDALGANWV